MCLLLSNFDILISLIICFQILESDDTKETINRNFDEWKTNPKNWIEKDNL